MLRLPPICRPLIAAGLYFTPAHTPIISNPISLIKHRTGESPVTSPVIRESCYPRYHLGSLPISGLSPFRASPQAAPRPPSPWGFLFHSWGSPLFVMGLFVLFMGLFRFRHGALHFSCRTTPVPIPPILQQHEERGLHRALRCFSQTLGLTCGHESYRSASWRQSCSYPGASYGCRPPSSTQQRYRRHP